MIWIYKLHSLMHVHTHIRYMFILNSNYKNKRLSCALISTPTWKLQNNYIKKNKCSFINAAVFFQQHILDFVAAATDRNAFYLLKITKDTVLKMCAAHYTIMFMLRRQKILRARFMCSKTSMVIHAESIVSSDYRCSKVTVNDKWRRGARRELSAKWSCKLQVAEGVCDSRIILR